MAVIILVLIFALLIGMIFYSDHYNGKIGKKAVEEVKQRNNNGDIILIHKNVFFRMPITFLICINQVWCESKRGSELSVKNTDKLYHYPMYRVYSKLVITGDSNYEAGVFKLEKGMISYFYVDHSAISNLKIKVVVDHEDEKYKLGQKDIKPKYEGI